MQDNRRRSSAGSNARTIESVLEKFSDKQFLTKYSLFNNLLSSEEFKLDASSNELLKTLFGTKTIAERELYEFAYFHMREKKIIIYSYLLHFLASAPKNEVVLMFNGERLDLLELKHFLTAQAHGGNPALWKEFEKRVIVLYIDSSNAFVFNLLYLPLLMAQRQFIKSVFICDINAFQSSDKSSLDKYYRKIPKDLTVVAFRKDFFQYKVIIKTALSFLNEGDQDLTEINEKVVRYLNRKIDQFHSHFSLVIPFEHIYNTAQTINDTYKSVILRLNHQGRIEELVFSSTPFKLEGSKEI